MHARFPLAVHALLMRGPEVLLLRRHNTGFADGLLSVPAGHVEPGETLLEAMARETREEVGLELEPEALRPIGIFHRLSEGRQRVDAFFEATAPDAEPRNLEPERCSELLWAPRAAPPDDTVPYVRAALTRPAHEAWVSDFGWERERPTPHARDLSAQQRVARFIAEHDLDATPHARLLDLNSELGELAKQWLVSTDYGKRDFEQTAEWRDELGDSFFALLAVAHATHVDLDATLPAALAKYAKRLRRSGRADSGR